MQIDKDKKKKQKTILIVLSILLVLTALSATTYSLFYTESVAANPSDYSTGLLSIEAKSKSDNIVLDNALPMEDSEGIETTPYVFTIKNNGNVDYKFDIKLLSANDNPISPQYIKLKVDDGSATTLSSLTNSIIKSNVILNAKESIDITLRVWLDINTPNTEMGKSFNSKIVIDGQAIYTETNYEPLNGAALQIYQKFNKTTTITNNCNTTEEIDEDNQIIKDPLGNLHYYGQEPNNYIKFNCETYPNTNCEIWRIIGVQDGKIKLIRNESIGSYSWDTSDASINTGYGINEWSQADLMKLLNPGYENESVGGSLYYNSQSGNCYTDRNKVHTACDFTSTGIKANTQKIISNTKYYTGGDSSSSIYSCLSLENERGVSTFSNSSDGTNRTTTWTGKIAVPYPSDYGYATDYSECNKQLGNYDNSDNNYACRGNNWMWYVMTGATSASSNGQNPAWFITSNSSNAYQVKHLYETGRVSGDMNAMHPELVFPVLYLDTSVNIDMSHTGSSTDPYVISN